MRHRDRFKIRKTALKTMAEERSWQCACGSMLEEEQERDCRSCQSYREQLSDWTWELAE